MTERAPWQSGRRLSCAAGALLGVAGAFPAGAQERDIERRAERVIRESTDPSRLRSDASLSLTERAAIDIGGTFNYTFLNLNDSDANSRRLNQYDTSLYGRASLDGGHTLFGRARFRYQDFSPGDSFNGRGDQWVEPFLDRYWYEFDLRDALDPAPGDRSTSDFDIRAGRQFVDWGAGLALSEVVLGVRPTLVLNDHLTIDGIAGETPTGEDVIDFDASREEYDRKTHRGYFGALARYTLESSHQIYAYALYMPDYNKDQTPRLDLGIPVDFKYTATYYGIGSNGSIGRNMLYEAEFVYEVGRGASDPLRTVQELEKIRAFAARGALTYILGDENLSRLQAEMLFASGDPDRLVTSDTVGGNLAGTVDRAFNSLGFANTGLAFAPTLSNLMSFRVGASTFPLRGQPGLSDLQVGMDVLTYGKLEEDGPINEPTRAETYLGIETDLFLNYRVTSDTALTVRYGAFFPGSAIAGSHTTRQFVLLGVTVSF